MKSILSELGLAFNADEYTQQYGNEFFLKLLKRYTVRTIDRTTKIPQITKLYTLVKAGGTKIIELPRFTLPQLVSSNPSTRSPVQTVEVMLPEHPQVETINYIGKSNPNQQIVVKHIVENVFGSDDTVSGTTLKMLAGCHQLDTEILMYDGSVKKVQDVLVGDQLMGDDSTPRNVLNLVRGQDTMYRVTNHKGESHVVNGDHILSLVYTTKKAVRYSRIYDRYLATWFTGQTLKLKKKRFETQTEATRFLGTINEDRKVDISVRQFLSLSKSWHKDLKEYKTKVDFPAEEPLPIDPYMIGYWLGDGNANTSIITTQDAKVIQYFQKNLGQYKCHFSFQGTSEYQYRINGDGSGKPGSNLFLNTITDLGLLENKHIPHIYKCSSRENRLKLLAGLIDSDGYLTDGLFEFCQSKTHERLFDDVLYLARSLGFACYKSQAPSTLRMRIYGIGIEEVPTLCDRKKAPPRRQIKDALVSQIHVQELSTDDYYGFQVDGNHRYVMGSFTVTHNCGKTFCAMDIIGKMRLKTLIVVPNTYLLDQWVNLLKEYFPDTSVGTLYGKQKKDGDIIVGIINTVSDLKSFVVAEKKPLPNVGAKVKYVKVETEVSVDDLLKTVGLTIFDESHMYVSKEFRKVFRRIYSRHTLGLSATPDIREDKLDIIHQLWLGPILDAEALDGFNMAQDSFESDVNMIEYHALKEHSKFSIREDGMIDYSSVVNAIVTDPNRNMLIIDEIVKLMKLDRYVFVFSDRRQHLEHLYELLEKRCNENGMCSQLELPESEKKVILYGGSSEETIGKAKTISTVVFTTYAYSSTGVSITKMNALVLTTPRRSNMKQIINRVFRLGSDQSIKRIIVDIVDVKFPIKQQVRERIKAYKDRGCDIIRSKHSACQ